MKLSQCGRSWHVLIATALSAAEPFTFATAPDERAKARLREATEMLTAIASKQRGFVRGRCSGEPIITMQSIQALDGHLAGASERDIAFAGMLVALSGAPCHAGSAPPRPDGTPAERRAVADPYAAFVTEASQRFGIPEDWIRAVRHEESADDPLAVSPKGAMGLMQIMPSTWRELRLRYDLGDNPIDPRTNILAGTAYLAELHERYGSPGFLAAYNAGPARYEEHRLLGVPLPDDTRAYLDRLAPIIPGDMSPGLFAGTAGHRAEAPQASLFAINMATRSDVSVSPVRSLFAADKRRDRQARPANDDSPDVQTD